MSSDYMTTLPLVEAARHPQQASGVPPARAPASIERNETVASGGNVPPGKAEEANAATDVEATVSQISDYVQNFQRSLQFSVDQDSGRTVIKVVDSKTEEVIRQIPAEEILRMAQRLDSPESLMLLERA